ncbi:MAG: hypothetical protein KME46_25965 [Brasilonema angustatum HA4187-MV1]|jgi:hypothetical protein|nr:hypothetical protein [Brasilonema angustatum HA4187-MV1]
MTKPDFESMTKEELRAYFIVNRDDNEAFYAYMDKVRETPGIEVTSEEQFTQVIEQKLRERQRERTEQAKSVNIRQMIIDEMESCPDYALFEVLDCLRIVKARINKLGY